MRSSFWRTIRLLVVAPLWLAACNQSADGLIPDGYSRVHAVKFIPRGYQCQAACRCLEVYLVRDADESEKRKLKRALFFLRGFAGPEAEESLEECDRRAAVSACRVPAADVFPEKTEAPDIWLVWYDTAEPGAEASRADCSPEGFVQF
jgi:hypothetical protein